tara:strand:- start:18 stop:407 length:390 start_codon:yes stop_codon:yes gene_type:complete
MAKRITNPMKNPRNMGNNRAASMRGNARRQGANQPFQGGFQGGLNINKGVSAQQPQARPQPQNGQSCPPGQSMRPDPNNPGQQTCQPAQPNLGTPEMGNVPVKNVQRAVNPRGGNPMPNQGNMNKKTRY